MSKILINLAFIDIWWSLNLRFVNSLINKVLYIAWTAVVITV